MDSLVLDVGYRPVAVAHWQNTIVWVLDRVAEVVEEHPEKFIRTVNWSVKMPSIVRLLKPIPKKKAVKFSRHGIYLRDNGRCQYCGNKVRKSEMQYEHVVPRAQGGKTCWENIVVACMPCNQRKGGRTPQQANMRLLAAPVRPKRLPDAGNLEMTYRKGMPDAWRTYLRDHSYWNAALEEG